MHRLLAVAVLLAVAPTARADNYLVLPFFNDSKDRSLDWIGDSLAESVREALASEGLIALDREDRNEAYQRLSIRLNAPLTKASVVKIGEALDAEQVVYGHFELKPVTGQNSTRSRGSLQVTAHLLDLKHFRQGPEFGEVGALEDLATLQRHLAWQTLASVLKTALSEADFNRLHPAVRVEALESYVRGLGVSNLEEKRRFFLQAVRLDPSYSQPCFQLGKLNLQTKEYKTAAEWLQKVSPDDVHSREATFLLGLCRFHSGDYAAAKLAFQSVASVVPLNEVLNNLGAAESRRNEPQALDSFEKALEGDSSDPVYHFNVGYSLWKQGKFEEAAAKFKAVLERNPDDADAKMLLARCEKKSGPRPGDAPTASLERLKANYEESAWWQLKAALQPQKE